MAGGARWGGVVRWLAREAPRWTAGLRAVSRALTLFNGNHKSVINSVYAMIVGR